MKYHQIPHTDLNVSKIALGTMTWGQQNNQQQAFEQMDYALERGVNFWDTAEMYPVPPTADTQGRTEQCIGNWFAQSGKRDQVILATKVAGPGGPAGHIRDNNKLDRANIEQALDDSLKRLKTDYVDLYQIHWPERQTNFFGQLNFAKPNQETYTPALETLEALGALVKAGKIRHIGISNETAWGAMEYLRLASKFDLPRMVTIQNPYNMLNRTFEVNLAEVAYREGVELLAYSPLAFGALSGKYLNNQWPEGARLTLYKRFARYNSEKAQHAIGAYVELAKQHGLDPSQMALAFVNSRFFLASNIIGATTMSQLKDNIDSIDIELSEAVLSGIAEIFDTYPNPCP